jgi:hypothetical protein
LAQMGKISYKRTSGGPFAKTADLYGSFELAHLTKVVFISPTKQALKLSHSFLNTLFLTVLSFSHCSLFFSLFSLFLTVLSFSHCSLFFSLFSLHPLSLPIPLVLSRDTRPKSSGKATRITSLLLCLEVCNLSEEGLD